MNFLTNLNLNKNELQNAVIQPLSSAPANPKEGQIYYNSTDKFIYRWDGAAWGPVGVVYNQESSTGVVITGLDDAGNVTTTDVTDLTLTGYTPVDDGYVSDGMTVEQAIKALDEAVKNAVAGGGEINQNAFSNVTVKKQSTATTAVAGATATTTISATSKTDTFTVASGNKWVDVGVDADTKQINIGHAQSGVSVGAYGDATHVAKVTVDAAGHVTEAESVAIVGAQYITGLTSDAQEQLNAKVPQTRTINSKALDADITLTYTDVGADAAGAADAVLGTAGDASTEATVYGARALAQEALDAAQAIDVPEYTIAKAETAQEGFLSSYYLTKDGAQVGEYINIPKDYLVKSASIKESTGDGDASGFPAGTKYIDFVVNTKTGSGTESHIYLNVEDLVDVYTAGNGIDISATNVVSAKVVAGNGLSVDADGIKMGAASADAAGAMSAAHYTKLEGIESGATKDTITLNGVTTQTPTFYAPATAGTAGQILEADAQGVPTWTTQPESFAFHKYTANNGALTAAGGAFTWEIPAATHGIANSVILIQVYEVASGEMVITDAVVNQTNYNVTIKINGEGTLAAGTYKAVLFG